MLALAIKIIWVGGVLLLVPLGFGKLVRLSVGGKIVALSILLVLGTAGTTGWVFHKNINSQLVSHESESLGEELHLQGVRMVAEIDSLRADARFLSSVPPIAGIIRARQASGIDPRDGSTEEVWHQRLTTILRELLQAKPHYTEARFIGVADKGREIVRVNRTDNGIVLVPVKDLQVKEHRLYFRQAIRIKKGDVHLSDISLNRDHGEVIEPHIPTVRAATPVYTPEGKVFGIVVINMNFSSILGKAPKGRHLHYVTNSKGDFLAHPDPTRTFGFDLGKRYHIQQVHPQLVGLFAPGNSKNELFVPLDDNKRILVFRKVHFDPLNPQRFLGLAQVASHEEANAESITIRNTSLQMTLVMMIVGVALAFLLSRKMVQPLQQITKAARSFAKDETLDVPNALLKMDQQNEIGVLAEAFRAMIQKVRERRDALQKSREQYRLVVDHAMDGIMTIDETGIVRSLNPAAESIFGYTTDDIIGKNIKMLMPEPYKSEHDGHLERYRHTGDTKILGTAREVPGQRRDGSVFPLEILVSEFSQGGQGMFLGLLRDVTERRLAEDALRESHKKLETTLENLQKTQAVLVRTEKLASIGTLSAGVAHEILNPLNIINAMVQTELMDDLTNETKETLQGVMVQVKRATKITNNLRMFAHPKKEEKVAVDIHQLFDNTTTLIEHDLNLENIVINRIYAPDLPVITADGDKLAQVFLNLLNNAKDAMKGGKDNSVTLLTQAVDDGVGIIFSDSGPGIPAAIIDKVFDPFFSTKDPGQGTGLGLSIIHSIIESHGGTISVASQPGKGTTFTIFLPLTGKPSKSLGINGNGSSKNPVAV